MQRLAATSNPDTSDSPVAWAGLFATATALARRLRGLIGQQAELHGASEAQFAVLWQCQQASSQGLGQHELSDRLAFSTAQISTLVEQLRQLGWLEGRRDPADRRRQCWQLTPAGALVTQQIIDELTRWATTRQLPCGPALPVALAALLRAMSEDHSTQTPPLRICEATQATPPLSTEVRA